jgi:hypothetical protein
LGDAAGDALKDESCIDKVVHFRTNYCIC